MINIDLNKETKATLASKVQEQAIQLENAVRIANFYGSKLEAIEALLVDSPFLSKGKIIKKIFWVISNFSQIAQLLQDIFTHIQEWRKVVDDLIQQAKNAQNKPTRLS